MSATAPITTRSTTRSGAVRRPSSFVSPETLHSARLRLVPRPRPSQAARLPFVLFITALLLGGVVCLLVFNTWLQQAAFRESQLREQSTELSAKAESMQSHLSDLADPDVVAAKAQAQGMVIPVAPAVLDIDNVVIEGTTVAADDKHTPTLKKNYAENPTMVYLPGGTGTDGSSTGAAADGQTAPPVQQ